MYKKSLANIHNLIEKLLGNFFMKKSIEPSLHF